MDEQGWLTGRFEENRPRLRGVAYRMLGALSEAEDAVQEEWLRFNRIDRPRRKPGRLVDHGRLASVSGHIALAEGTARRCNWRAGHPAEGPDGRMESSGPARGGSAGRDRRAEERGGEVSQSDGGWSLRPTDPGRRSRRQSNRALPASSIGCFERCRASHYRRRLSAR